MSRCTVITLAALLGGCAHIPPSSEHDQYASLSDYIQRGYSPPELKRFHFFTWETPPQSITLDNHVVTFIGDKDGPGYCLRLETILTTEKYLEESTFCSFNGLPRLAGYGWGIIAPNGKLLRYESSTRNYGGQLFNGNTWEGLEQQFHQLRIQFLKVTNNIPQYADAVKRVWGI